MNVRRAHYSQVILYQRCIPCSPSTQSKGLRSGKVEIEVEAEVELKLELHKGDFRQLRCRIPSLIGRALQQFLFHGLVDMSRLRVHVLGGLSVCMSGGRSFPVARSCRSVLGYLITHRHRSISRVELAETLWANHDSHHARRCLSTALWRLKTATKSGPRLLAFHSPDELSFNWNAPIWVDSIALELRLRPLLRLKPDTLTREAINRLERGILLYKGEYLTGIDDEWAWLERQRLRNLYVDGLYQLISAYEVTSNWRSVLHWGRLLSQEDPLREDVHRMLMRAYVLSGNRAKAISQYRQCEHILQADLGVEPMPETQALYRQLLCLNAPGTISGPLGTCASSSVDGRIAHIQRALESSRKQLDQVIDILRHTGVPPVRD
jgi:DNA-binding SARP family transcriptional activator